MLKTVFFWGDRHLCQPWSLPRYACISSAFLLMFAGPPEGLWSQCICLNSLTDTTEHGSSLRAASQPPGSGFQMGLCYLFKDSQIQLQILKLDFNYLTKRCPVTFLQPLCIITGSNVHLSIHPSICHSLSIYHVSVTVWELEYTELKKKDISVLSRSFNFIHTLTAHSIQSHCAPFHRNNLSSTWGASHLPQIVL